MNNVEVTHSAVTLLKNWLEKKTQNYLCDKKVTPRTFKLE